MPPYLHTPDAAVMPNRVSNFFAAFATFLFLAAVIVPTVLWQKMPDADGRVLAAVLGGVLALVAVMAAVGAVVSKQRR